VSQVSDVMLRSPKIHDVAVTVGELRSLFTDDHVHMALLVDDGRLVAAVERGDLEVSFGDGEPAARAGRLDGRTVTGEVSALEALQRMRRESLRRLAVVDGGGALLGLLCRTSRGDGFCSDDGVESRRREREAGLPD
jgi:CBS domain-containing protein